MDFINILQKNIPINLIQPRRAQIYVGFQCHQKCGFCYYKYKCTEPMFNLNFIKKQIDFELAYGIEDFEITGGEPSEYLQLRDVCEYIKSKSSKSKIAIITNGGLFNSNVWDIIDEVLVSYHVSKNDPNIDKTIFPLGNTYNKVEKTIVLAKQNNVLVRTNTVLAAFNLNGLMYLIDDLISFSPTIINFLPVNLFDQALEMFDYIDYDILREKIKYAINKLQNTLPKSLINVRYMPFCQMEGYEKHIVGNLQHIYDWFDWNRELDGISFLNYLQNNNESLLLTKLGKYGSTSLLNVSKIQNILYEKDSKCLKCKYLMICDGVEKTNNSILTKFIKPSFGKLISNFMEFRNTITQELYYNIYG